MAPEETEYIFISMNITHVTHTDIEYPEKHSEPKLIWKRKERTLPEHKAIRWINRIGNQLSDEFDCSTKQIEVLNNLKIWWQLLGLRLIKKLQCIKNELNALHTDSAEEREGMECP